MIYLLFLLLPVGEHGQFDVAKLTEIAGISDTNCLSTDVDSLMYFPEVSLVTLDTTCPQSSGTFSVHVEPGYLPMRVAIDSAGNIFRLSNLGASEFNDLVDMYPPKLTSENLYAYGILFVETTQFWLLPWHYFITTSDQLRANKENLRSWITREEAIEKFDKNIAPTEAQIDSLSNTLDVEHLRYDTSANTHLADYFIWTWYNGDLREISISISNQGHCTIIRDSIVARKTGYYDPATACCPEGINPEGIDFSD